MPRGYFRGGGSTRTRPISSDANPSEPGKTQVRAALRRAKAPDAAADAAVAAAVARSRAGGTIETLARRFWAAPGLLSALREPGRAALAAGGAREELAVLARLGPVAAADADDGGVDAWARLLATLGALGRRILSSTPAAARVFAVAATVALERTTNAVAAPAAAPKSSLREILFRPSLHGLNPRRGPCPRKASAEYRATRPSPPPRNRSTSPAVGSPPRKLTPSQVLSDDDVVVRWVQIKGARTPVTLPRRLRDAASLLLDAREGCLGSLHDALTPQDDVRWLDATSADDVALDATLAGTSADALSEASAKAKKSLLAEVVGSSWARAPRGTPLWFRRIARWSVERTTPASSRRGKKYQRRYSSRRAQGSAQARKLEKTATSMEKSFLKAFGASKIAGKTQKRDAAASAAPPKYGPRATADAEALARFLATALAAAAPPLRVSALTALAFRNDAPRRFWSATAARRKEAAAALEAYAAASDEKTLPGDVALAACAGLLLRHALVVADDDDVRDGRPLAPAQLRRVVSTSRGGVAEAARSGVAAGARRTTATREDNASGTNPRRSRRAGATARRRASGDSWRTASRVCAGARIKTRPSRRTTRGGLEK